MKGPTNAQSVNIDATPTDGSGNPVSSNGVYDALATKQATLVSETNIKTINSTSLLGSGNVAVGTVTTTGTLTANQIATFNANNSTVIKSSGYTIATSVPANAVFTDTKNTAGTSSKTGTKLFLAGATSQTDGVQTFSNENCYIGTDNCLYSGGTKVLTAHQSLSNYVTLNTNQTIQNGLKTFRGTNYPTSEPANGATNTLLQLSMWGGSAGKTNFANVAWVNKDNKTVGFHGPIQSGSTNSNGWNGFRIGLRDREDLNWKAFFTLYSTGEMYWDGAAWIRTNLPLTCGKTMGGDDMYIACGYATSTGTSGSIPYFSISYGVTFKYAPYVVFAPQSNNGADYPSNAFAVFDNTKTGCKVAHGSSIIGGFQWIAMAPLQGW